MFYLYRVFQEMVSVCVLSLYGIPGHDFSVFYLYMVFKEMVSVCSIVCKKWRVISQDSRLWSFVSLRPEISGLHIHSIDFLLKIIQHRCAIDKMSHLAKIPPLGVRHVFERNKSWLLSCPAILSIWLFDSLSGRLSICLPHFLTWY